MNYTDWTVSDSLSAKPMARSKSRSLTRETLLRAASQVILDKGLLVYQG